MMATAVSASGVDQIGETAGIVWQKLVEDGPVSTAKLAGSIDAPRDTVMQAIGWLAREDKVCIEQTKRGRVISLR
jgi:hypothetical protein